MGHGVLYFAFNALLCYDVQETRPSILVVYQPFLANPIIALTIDTATALPPFRFVLVM